MQVAATTANKQTQSRAAANNVSLQKNNRRGDSEIAEFVDNRPETKALKSLQMMINSSSRMVAQRQRMANITGGTNQVVMKKPTQDVQNGPAESSKFIHLYSPTQNFHHKEYQKKTNNERTKLKLKNHNGHRPIQRAEVQLILKDGKGEDEKYEEYIGRWQNESIELAIKLVRSEIQDKGLYTKRITQKQVDVFERNYQDLIFNALDQALKLYQEDNAIGLGITFGANIVKSGNWVLIMIWDSGGGFPKGMLGTKDKKPIPEKSSQKKEGLFLGGMGIGLQRLINEVKDEGGDTALTNKKNGAMVVIRFKYLSD